MLEAIGARFHRGLPIAFLKGVGGGRHSINVHSLGAAGL